MGTSSGGAEVRGGETSSQSAECVSDRISGGANGGLTTKGQGSLESLCNRVSTSSRSKMSPSVPEKRMKVTR